MDRPIPENAPGGDTSFFNNLPDPVTTAAELPRFKFELEASEGRQDRGSFGKQVTVDELPLAKGMAGVSMKLQPGVMREMHWHATAAEWAYVLEGRVRTTVVDPAGHSETNDFDPGDIWYFPRGHGHMLECLGDEPCHFILIFDNGYQSEFATFSLTDWMAQVPKAILAKSLGMSEEQLGEVAAGEVYFATGGHPPGNPAEPRQGTDPPGLTHRYRLASGEPTKVHPGGREWRADTSVFPISRTVTGVVFDLDAGAIRELHWHPNADEWHYLVSGEVKVTMFGSKGRYREELLSPGDVGYIPQGFGHSLENISKEVARIVIGLNSGTYQTMDLSQWIAGQSDDVLETNLGKSASELADFPKRDLFINDGR